MSEVGNPIQVSNGTQSDNLLPKPRLKPIRPLPKLKAKHLDPVWCILCERPIGPEYDNHLDLEGGVVCRTPSCKRSFHSECLKLRGETLSESTPFQCRICIEKQVVCPECQLPVLASEGQLCSKANCKRVYHRTCWKWGDGVCPWHSCAKCKRLDVPEPSLFFNGASDRYSCLRCSLSYHVCCLPKGTKRLVLNLSNDNRMICPRHELLPKSVVWRPHLLIPFWLNLDWIRSAPTNSFSLPVEWYNEQTPDGSDVVIGPQNLINRLPKRARIRNDEKENEDVDLPITKKNPKERIVVHLNKKLFQNASLLMPSEEFEFVPEFVLEPPVGFVHAAYKRRARNVYANGLRPIINSMEAAHICFCASEAHCADESCVNRSLQIECDARFCRSGDRCQNQRLQKKEWQPLRLIYTKDRGCGMMSMIPIAAGALVIEYVGEVLDEVTFRRRIEENTEQKRPQDNYYMFQLNRQFTIDAKRIGNDARFINHSCSPNCRAEIWETRGELRAGIFAMDDIAAGVEITYDYQFELFSKAVNSDCVPCKCGAKNCTRFLGAKKTKDKKKARN